MRTLKPKQILLVRGSQFLRFTSHVWGTAVQCPGCGAVAKFPNLPGTVEQTTMVHADGCDVLARITGAERDTCR